MESTTRRAAEVANAFEDAARTRKVWSKRDVPAAALEKILEGAGPDALRGIVDGAKRSIVAAQLAALLVVRHPDLPWPACELSEAIARRLAKDKPEQKTARYDAVLALAARERGVTEHLLRTWVIGAPADSIEAVLVADLAERQRDCPTVFLDALKRVASVTGQQLVLSGLVLRGFADLPPAEDDAIREEIRSACERFDDDAWIARSMEERLLELFAEVLSLSAILLDPAVFSAALKMICRFLARREWHVPVAAGLMSPLVMWKDDVVHVAPWMEDAYEKELLQMAGASWGSEAVALVAHIRSGRYRNLKRNRVIEGKQAWRQWAKERAAGSLR
jgi:hypothetical protein